MTRIVRSLRNVGKTYVESIGCNWVRGFPPHDRLNTPGYRRAMFDLLSTPRWLSLEHRGASEQSRAGVPDQDAWHSYLSYWNGNLYRGPPTHFCTHYGCCPDDIVSKEKGFQTLDDLFFGSYMKYEPDPLAPVPCRHDTDRPGGNPRGDAG